LKVADQAPTYCSACHCQDTELQHVDFEAYWDGPVIDGKSFKQPIDDLILCSNCLEAAATLIGMVNNKQMRKENFELGRANDEKQTYIDILEKAISDLEHTLGLSLSGRIKRGKGRPAIRIPDNIKDLVDADSVKELEKEVTA
jgi:hypothetical protein